jgi:hypothetical protein
MAMLMLIFLALIFLSFLPCIMKTVQRFILDHMSAIANQKFNQLYLQGYQLLQNLPENYYEGPYQDATESEALVPYNAPCQQEAAKRPTLLPNSRSSAPTLIFIKEKMRE